MHQQKVSKQIEKENLLILATHSGKKPQCVLTYDYMYMK